jgi:two-component system heavy metal sensor histidine kinase CusS
MSLKSVLRNPRFNSLTWRLAGMFAIVSIATLGVAGAYLYTALHWQLAQADKDELFRTIEAARHRVAEADTPEMLRARPFSFQNLASRRQNLTLVLRAEDGSTILEINPVPQPLPAIAPVPAGTTFNPDALTAWRPAGGARGHIGSAWALLGDHHGRVLVIAAMASPDRTGMLAGYRIRILEATVAGTVVAFLLGLALIRTGLKPLHALAAEAATVTVNRLQTRLDAHSAPRELQELATAVNGMLGRIEEGFSRLSQFSADVAHDLRTPISNLLGQTEVALSQPRSAEEYQALLVSNVEEFERLARMMESMMFLARADNAQVALDRQQVEVRAELGRIADYFEGMAEEAGIHLRIDCGKSAAPAGGGATAAEPRLAADPILFRRAVNNLVANAIRYTPRGGEITMSFAQSAGAAVVAVRNPGPGIAPEHLPRLFDRFYRTDPARTDSAMSAGLGLAIVKSVMGLHGGRVEVESRVDQSTVFRLIFPAGQTLRAA